jgi:hypothetical protein
MDDSGEEVPIDKKENDGGYMFTAYRMCHNHYLFAHKDEEQDPSWWDDVTTAVVSGYGKYLWAKDADARPSEDWNLVKDPTKKIESVLVPAPVVVATTRFQSYNEAVAKRETVGKRTTPARTFGITGEWLVAGSAVSPDGKRWVCTTRYMNAPKWDTDYYS